MNPDVEAGQIGYGAATVAPSPPAGFAFANWANPASYFLGSTGTQLLVLTATRRALVETSFALDSYHQSGIHRASIAGWMLRDAYLAPDGHIYVLIGRSNPTESTSRAVIEVRQYDQNLRLLGTAQVDGGFDSDGVYDGLGASAPDMVLAGTTLIVHMSRAIFHIKGDWAAHHEVNLAFAVDTSTMTATDIPDRPYASHSFNEFVATAGDDVLFIDHGDAYPRGVQLGIMHGYLAPNHGQTWNTSQCGPTVGTPTDPVTGQPLSVDPSYCWQSPTENDYMVFTIPADNAALANHNMLTVNFTGTTVNGFGVADSRALTVGLSVPNGHAIDGVTGHSPHLRANVYLTSTDTATGATTLVWLTTRNPQDQTYLELQPALTPLANGDFAVVWDEWHEKHVTMQYRLVDDTGTVLAQKQWSGHSFAAVSQPVLAGHRILWVGSSTTPGSRNYLRGINVRNPADPVLIER